MSKKKANRWKDIKYRLIEVLIERKFQTPEVQWQIFYRRKLKLKPKSEPCRECKDMCSQRTLMPEGKKANRWKDIKYRLIEVLIERKFQTPEVQWQIFYRRKLKLKPKSEPCRECKDMCSQRTLMPEGKKVHEDLSLFWFKMSRQSLPCIIYYLMYFQIN